MRFCHVDKGLLDFSIQLSNFCKAQGRNPFKSWDAFICTGLQDLGFNPFGFHPPSLPRCCKLWGKSSSFCISVASAEHL